MLLVVMTFSIHTLPLLRVSSYMYKALDIFLKVHTLCCSKIQHQIQPNYIHGENADFIF